MPERTDNDVYEWKLTDDEEARLYNIDPSGWDYRTTVASGFFMYENATREERGVQEAGIGPTEDGNVRAYISTEQPDGSYDNDERFEGGFDEALERLLTWFNEY